MDQPTYQRVEGEGIVHLSTGDLVLLSKVQTFVAYDAPPLAPPDPDHLLLYTEGPQEQRLASVEEVVAAVIRPRGLDLRRELLGQEYAFLFMLRLMLGLGRVISRHPLYEFIGPTYGIDPARHEPHSDGGILRFAVLCTSFSLYADRRSYVAEVRLDLRTMEHTVALLAYQRR